MARQTKKRGGADLAEFAEAKVSMTGRSQAVRLPKEYRVSGDSVYVKRVGNGILLLPKTGGPDCSRRSIYFLSISRSRAVSASRSAPV